MGPIQIFVLGFEDFQATGRLADELGALTTAGTIRIVDARVLLRESAHELAVVRIADLGNSQREDLRAAAHALIRLREGARGRSGHGVEGMILETDAALDVAELGMCEAEIVELAEELEIGGALLLIVIENVWATGLANALRGAGVVFAQQDYLSHDGLVALGAMLGLEVANDH